MTRAGTPIAISGAGRAGRLAGAPIAPIVRIVTCRTCPSSLVEPGGGGGTEVTADGYGVTRKTA